MYNYGDVIDISAIPEDGWQFDGWSGDVADPQSATTTFVVTSNANLTANFSPMTYKISMDVEGQGLTQPATGTYDYRGEEIIDIIATPDEGWQFEGWSGDVTDPDSTATTLLADADKTVTAIFSPITHSISLLTEGSGSISPAPGLYEFDEGSSVNIAASPDEGWQFEGWSGDVTDSLSTETTITVNSDATVTAKFSKIGWFQAIRIVYSEILYMFMSLGT